MSGPRHFNIVSIFTYLLIVVAIYFSYLYAPLLWKRNQLEDLIKEESFGAKGKPPLEARNSIIKSAEDRLQVELLGDDVQVRKFEDRVQVDVIWRVTLNLVFGQKLNTTFHLNRETVFY